MLHRSDDPESSSTISESILVVVSHSSLQIIFVLDDFFQKSILCSFVELNLGRSQFFPVLLELIEFVELDLIIEALLTIYIYNIFLCSVFCKHLFCKIFL